MDNKQWKNMDETFLPESVILFLIELPLGNFGGFEGGLTGIAATSNDHEMLFRELYLFFGTPNKPVFLQVFLWLRTTRRFLNKCLVDTSCGEKPRTVAAKVKSDSSRMTD